MSNSREKIRKILFLTGFELKKIFRQKHAAVGLAVLLLLVGLCSIGTWIRLNHHGENKFEGRIMSELVNGISFSETALLPGIYILLPMMIGILAASVFAGEFEGGQIRMISIRPVSRTSILMAKFMAVSIYAYICLFFLMVISYAAGAALFGFSGDIVVFGPAFLGGNAPIYILNSSEAWTRLFLSYYLAGYSLISIAGLFIMFSAVIRKLTIAIIIPLGIYFTSYILDVMPFMDSLHKFLPTRYIMIWKYVMAPQIRWDSVANDGIFLALYTFCYMAIAIFCFKTKDI